MHTLDAHDLAVPHRSLGVIERRRVHAVVFDPGASRSKRKLLSFARQRLHSGHARPKVERRRVQRPRADRSRRMEPAFDRGIFGRKVHARNGQSSW